MHILNVSISTQQDAAEVEAALSEPLMKLAAAIAERMSREEDDVAVGRPINVAAGDRF